MMLTMTKTSLYVIWALAFVVFPVMAEDWTTTDGKVYQGVKVVKVEADSVTILDSDGGARLALAILPPDLQKRFNYDPVKAKAAADARAKEDAVNAATLQAEMNQADAMKQAKYAEEEQQRLAQAQTQQRASVYSSHGGTAPVPVAAPRAPTADDLIAQEEWSKAQVIKKEDAANGYSHSSGRVIQVLPDGFIGNVSTRWGIYDPGFVKCNSKDMIDGQSWTGILIPFHTFQYKNGFGELATIPAFTTDLTQTASSPAPSNYIAPPRPVSSLQAVGGG